MSHVLVCIGVNVREAADAGGVDRGVDAKGVLADGEDLGVLGSADDQEDDSQEEEQPEGQAMDPEIGAVDTGPLGRDPDGAYGLPHREEDGDDADQVLGPGKRDAGQGHDLRGAEGDGTGGNAHEEVEQEDRIAPTVHEWQRLGEGRAGQGRVERVSQAGSQSAAQARRDGRGVRRTKQQKLVARPMAVVGKSGSLAASAGSDGEGGGG